MNVILPALEDVTPADLREGRGATILARNRAIQECAAAIRHAGGTVSHQIAIQVIYLDDGLRIDSPRCYRV